MEMEEVTDAEKQEMVLAVSGCIAETLATNPGDYLLAAEGVCDLVFGADDPHVHDPVTWWHSPRLTEEMRGD